MNIKLKNIICLGLLALIIGFNTSCENSNSSTKGDYLAVKQETDGLWSLLAPDGSMLFENEFKQNISDAIDGLFLVPEENLLSLYKAESVPIPLKDFTDLFGVGTPNEGKVVLIDNEGKILAIKTSGDKLFTLPTEIIACHSSFHNNLLGVCDDKANWGFVNEQGQQIIPCKYIAVTPFSEGHAIVAEYKNDNLKLSIIDKTGEVTAVVKNYLRLIDSSREFHNGRIPVVNIDDQLGFLTVNGVFEKCSYKVTGIKNVTDNGFIFQKADGKFGAMNFEGEILVQPRYDELAFIPGSKNYIAKIKDRYSELDEKGEKIMDFTDYKYMKPGSSAFPIIASTGHRYELLDARGKLISKTDFAEVNSKLYFSNEILYPSVSDLFNFNVEIANYLDQVFLGFNVKDSSMSVSLDESNTDSEEDEEMVETPDSVAAVQTEIIPEEKKTIEGQNSKNSAPKSENTTPTTSKGNYNYGYASYSGEMKNGKPNGKGRLTFSSKHSDNVRNYSAEAGDYIEGYFTNGQLENGTLYKSDGSKIKSIY